MTALLDLPTSDTAPLPRDGFVLTMGKISYAHTPQDEEANLENQFKEQVERWKEDTQLWSSVTKMLAHPSYLRVIGLARKSNGTQIERLLLKELESEPDYWFDALTAITGKNPVKPEYDFDQSVEAWLEWGRQKGIIEK